MKKWILIVYLLSHFGVKAQLAPGPIRQFLSVEANVQKLNIRHVSALHKLYENQNYQLLWLPSDRKLQTDLFFYFLYNVADLGLKEEDYGYQYLNQCWQTREKITTCRDSIVLDLQISDAAISFFRDIKNGNKEPTLSYKGIEFKPDENEIVAALSFALETQSLSRLPEKLEPSSTEYRSMKRQIVQLNKTLSQEGFKEVVVESTASLIDNKKLIEKLFQLGFLDTSLKPLTNSLLAQRLQLAQKSYNLATNAKLDAATIKALNVSLFQHRKKLSEALNTIRWINAAAANQELLVVNVAAATLLFYKEGACRLESRVIVGKPTTPTPLLSSRVSEVVLYPYWHVPKSIATKELLPNIKKNIAYLDQNNFQILSLGGKLVDPYSINWKALSTSYFPYTIRQSTGCDNSLGIVKLNFTSPYSVYLHDTPGKGLFFLNKRYFSHGCVRVEKALEISKELLGEKSSLVDSAIKKGCLYNQAPINISLTRPVNVVLLYQTAWFNKEGLIFFFEDVYHKDQ